MNSTKYEFESNIRYSCIIYFETSSLWTDTTLERNMLMETVYPRLKDYCRERHGLDFQVGRSPTSGLY